MSAETLFTRIQYVAAIHALAAEIGVDVEIGADFARYRAIRAAQQDRAGLYPMFDPFASFVDEGNGFWVVGRDRGGAVVHTQAVRLLDLGAMSLAEHLSVHRHKYMTRRPDAPEVDARYTPPPQTAEIYGMAAYHGDFWLRADGNYRGRNLTALLARMAIVLGYMQWRPDCFFGFLFPNHAAGGLAARYGYVHCGPGSWRVSADAAPSSEWLVWMHRQDVEAMIGHDPVEFYRQLEVKSASRTPQQATT